MYTMLLLVLQQPVTTAACIHMQVLTQESGPLKPEAGK